nr:MAG TPA: Nuclear polyadenylated RNA-binding 2 protein CCCH zinc finger 1 [Bacteriophage sp.]
MFYLKPLCTDRRFCRVAFPYCPSSQCPYRENKILYLCSWKV